MENVIKFSPRNAETPINNEIDSDQSAEVVDLFTDDQKEEIERRAIVNRIKSLAEECDSEDELNEIESLLDELKNSKEGIPKLLSFSVSRIYQHYPKLAEHLSSHPNIEACLVEAAITSPDHQHPAITVPKRLAILALSEVPGIHYGFGHDSQINPEK